MSYELSISNIWSSEIKPGFMNYRIQQNNEMCYFYILEILESEIKNAKNILDINNKSLESLKQLKSKFIRILNQAQEYQSQLNSTQSNKYSSSNIEINTNTNINTNSNNNFGHLHKMIPDNSLENTDPQEYIKVLNSKIKEMDNEIDYIYKLNGQPKERLKILNNYVNYYLLNIDTILL
jgi:hypothetical protein